MRSRFVKNAGMLNRVKLAFERWLINKGYDAVSGLYPGAVDAFNLIDDFLEDYPKFADDLNSLEHHAEAIGLVSDYVPDNIEFVDDEEPDINW